MDTSTLVWTVIAAIAALVVVGALVFVSQRKLAQRHRTEATTIRDHAAEHAHQVGIREALADQAEADARGMQAQADVKAAVAARLQHGAATRRDEAVAARAEVDMEFVHADEIDPDSQSPNDLEPAERERTTGRNSV